MFKLKTIFYLILVFFFVTKTAAQMLSPIDDNRQSVVSLLGLDQNRQSELTNLPTAEMMIASVDENEYFIDGGDVFIIKIDVEGPAFKVFNSIVTSDGYIVIPDAPAILIKNLTLKAAKTKINQILRKSFPRAQIESYLLQVHPIRVTILGALPRPGKIRVRSSDRLFDAVSRIVEPQIADTTIRFAWNTISMRNIEIKRRQSSLNYDLMNFRLTGDVTRNPYLMDEDIIYINYRDTIEHNISISGAVGRSIEVEYKQGDSLGLAVDFASGLLPTADSSRIELVRIEANTDTFGTIILKLPDDLGYLLKPDDRIYIRKKKQAKKSAEVLIRGEVLYPGTYAIESGKSRLSEVIGRAGGFTSKASMQLARVERMAEYIQEEPELLRLKMIPPLEMSQEEVSFYRLQSRENRILVATDFNKVFHERNTSQDIFLYDRDVINIPEKTMTVFVSGGVRSPGKISYNPDWSYEEYIEAAGGYSEFAREGWTTVIDARTGKWKDADDNLLVGEGDIIFVPEHDRIDWYKAFVDGLGIVSQVATIVLIVVSLTK